MRSLSDTISRLALLRARLAEVKGGDAADRLSDFTSGGSNPGALKAKAYLPEGMDEGAPLVVVLHGCTQTATGYDLGSGWSILADRAGFALLFPEQQRSNNPNGCFNWFLPDDTRRDAGEAFSIRQMVEAFAAEHRIDRRRIFITGLSAGGAMTSVMLACYPELFAGGAIIAGLPFGVANTIPEAFDRMRGHGVPSASELQNMLRSASSHAGSWPILSVWHGDADRTVAASNMDGIVAQWRGLHAVGEAPTLSEMVEGHPHKVWQDDTGKAVIETYSIAGMGHGTPLRTSGAEAFGASGPFMLDVGISSTLRIAQFWGIAVRGEAGTNAQETAFASPPEGLPMLPPPAGPASAGETPRLLKDVRIDNRQPSPRGSKVQNVIEDALRVAGLMK